MKRLLAIITLLGVIVFLSGCSVSTTLSTTEGSSTQSVTSNTSVSNTSVPTFTVTFDSRGGTAVDNVSVLSGSTILLPTPTKAGYDFLGWFLNDSFDIEFVTTSTVSANITLYAKWSSYYYVVFTTNGGNEIPWAYVDDILANLEAFIPVRIGYTFAGWYLDYELTMPAGSLEEIIESMIGDQRGIALFAKWERILYTIDFYYKGVQIAPQRQFPYGEQLAFHVFPDPELGSEYEVWAGWFEDLGSEMPFSQGAMPDRNIILHAKYIPFQYQLHAYVFEVPSFVNGEYQIRVGDSVSVIYTDYRVYTWGNFDLGLNKPVLIDSAYPVEITSYLNLASGERIIEAAAGWYHVLLATSHGRVFAWGNNSAGQVGDGTTNHRVIPVEITSSLNLAQGEGVVQIHLGASHSLVLTTNNRLLVWGYNGHASLGLGSAEPEFIALPVDITNRFSLGSTDRIKEILIQSYATMVITEQGRLFAWGWNRSVFSGFGDVNGYVYSPLDITSRLPLGIGEGVRSVSLGGTHCHVLTSTNRVLTWGSGFLGAGDIGYLATPTDTTAYFVLQPDEKIIVIKSASFRSIAVTSNNRLFVWGYNLPGGLGDGTNVNRTTPLDITERLNLNSNETIESVVLANDRSYLKTSENRLFGWGRVDILGFMPATNVNTPTLVQFASLQKYGTILNVNHGTTIKDIPLDIVPGYQITWYWDQQMLNPVKVNDTITGFTMLFGTVVGD